MSSLPRRIQRRNLRAKKDYEPKSRFSRVNADGSISVLHPTRGFRRTCAKRVALHIEQARMIALSLATQGAPA